MEALFSQLPPESRDSGDLSAFPIIGKNRGRDDSGYLLSAACAPLPVPHPSCALSHLTDEESETEIKSLAQGPLASR